MRTKVLSTIASALLVGNFLVGCGSSSDSSTTPTTDTSGGSGVTQTSISGKAVDGYLRYSSVCLDLSKDGYCQPSEPYALTDENGEFELTLTSLHREHENFATASLVVYGGQDSDTAEDFIGKLKSPNDGSASINVTPLTTLVAEIVNSGAEIATARTQVATVLGLNEADVGEDPVALALEGNSAPLSKALQVQKAVERMVKDEVGDTAKASSASALYAALAETMNNQTAPSDVSAIVESSRTAITGVVSNPDIDGAIVLSALVEEAIANTQSFTTDSISEVASVISVAKNETTISDTTTLVSASEALLSRARAFGDELGTDGDAILYLFDHNFGTSGSYDGPLKLSMSYAQMKTALENAESIVNPNPSLFTVTKEQVIEYLDEKLAEIAEAIAAVEETQEQAELAAKPFIAINTPFSMYNIDSWMEWDGTSSNRVYVVQQDRFENNEITWTEASFDGTQWLDDEEEFDYILQANGTWARKSMSFTPQSDNSLMTANGEKFGIVEEKDLEGSHEVKFSNVYSINVTMPTGAKQYISKVAITNDAYLIWDPKRDYSIPMNEPIQYIQTLEEFIEKQCGDRWFMGDESGGYAFAATSTQTPTQENGWQSYTCNTSATSGRLNEVVSGGSIINTNAGIWERKTVNGQDMILVTPYDTTKYGEYDEDSRLFVEANPDGEGVKVWEGAFDKAGVVYTWKSYNQTAIDAIKAHIAGSGSSSRGTGASQTSVTITSEMLEGQTFYAVHPEDSTMHYVTVTFSATHMNILTKDAAGNILDNSSVNYSLQDGKIETAENRFTLMTQHQDYWLLECVCDDDGDGVKETTDSELHRWDTVIPEGFPS